MATRVSRVNFRDTVILHNLENRLFAATILAISQISRDIANFVLKLANFRYHGNKGHCGVNFNDTVKLRDPQDPLFGLRISAISITQTEKWLILR